ncbi:MORN repeat-containing protein 5 [Drosophila elegans]|uniref:MORN repeat-containing protein 5 n=1 Tax=Drosophila elegans TaxID=30023 RepID=UPI0007E6B7DF|nr:MORN repeat-containing protein 5 [Drosophila elegans]
MTQRIQSNSIAQVDNLMTGARYVGPSDELGMQEFGVYSYPDGTRYTGGFLNNRFHGRGTIQMADPSGVTFEVTHRKGKLMTIDQINFNDALPLDFEMVDHRSLSFESWPYCTAEDRRFYQETKEPLQAVGPKKFKTKDGPNPIALGRNIFDLGFGLMGNRGFMLDTKTFSHQRSYMSCREARRWTREHCAHGPLWNRHHKQEVKARFARQIIQNNRENADGNRKHFMPDLHVCHRSSSLDSFGSTRLHLASTTDSDSSELPTMKMHRHEFRNQWKRSRSESNVCRIN